MAVTPAGAIAAYELETAAQGASAGLRVIVRSDGSACIVRADIGTNAWNMPYTDRYSGTVPVTVYRPAGGGRLQRNVVHRGLSRRL